MQIDRNNLYTKTYTAAFLGCIAVLPMSDTIALRNIFLVLMLLLLIIGSVISCSVREDVLHAIKMLPIPLLLWIVYLCIFPLWAPKSEIAWENLRGQWGESIVAWVVGFGAAAVLGGSGLSLWKLGLASAFPLTVHLVLACFSYFGFFSAEYYGNQNLGGLTSELLYWIHGDSAPGVSYHPIDKGFLGIETQPGNIGYASSIAIGLLATQFFIAKFKNNTKEMVLSFTLIILCFLSILIARTRGGFIFSLLMIGMAAISVRLSVRSIQAKNVNLGRPVPVFGQRNLVLLAGALIFLCISYLGMKSDPRWATMADKVRAGFTVVNPISSLCTGLAFAEEKAIRDRLTDKPTSYVQDVIDGVKGQDGGRVILMRAGIQLVLKNPIGLDGSRQSYERLIRVECNGIPVLNFANAHNSWIDLSLALGWLGSTLFLILFIYFIRYSIIYISDSETMPIVAALGVIATFWMIRGFFDALYREHYLEMQALMIAYLYTASAIKTTKKSLV